jgi:uncharacterized membrane protein YhaH (DUF805 family)
MNWYLGALKNYVGFSGRARRKEYWMFVWFNILVSIVLYLADRMLGTLDAETGVGLLGALYSLGVLLPSLAVAVRRLHDTGRSGWWLLIGFVPLIGAIVLLVFFVLDGEPGSNAHGPNPKQVAA